MENAKIWEQEVIIPTYEVGSPDKNPMFLQKRVYQGSSGKLYPYPTTVNISDKKTDKVYHAVYLENEYIKIMVLPELGGRIQRAYDKTNDYDFVYYNHVIKPALVGLAGPWISGGIEFNWPQHHRPTTFMGTDYLIKQNQDGSVSLLINDTDQMYGTKSIATFTLYPGKAYIEIKGQLYNPTALPQTFLWWANPAVAVNENTQSVFPPDVHNVYDHGKRDVSEFPIARGVYYKHDYSQGVDISCYKNIPVPTSYMAETSEYDFVGGYDYGKEAGLLHVADHHYSPGKKQWTWGCGDFGKAWDRNLTDEDGPYIELMTGVYTENQPDFSYLKPFEEKTFKQYFMPYKKVGMVKNATINAALGVEYNDNNLDVTVYATSKIDNARLSVNVDNKEVYTENMVISPVDIYQKQIDIAYTAPESVVIKVYSGDKVIVQYQQMKQTSIKNASPALAAKEPCDIKTNEELLLTAQHIEQHRHATFMPDPYYEEGLKRDPLDSRINNAYGLLKLRRGDFEGAEEHFRKAIERITLRSPNPYTSEPYYNLGLTLFYQKKYNEAYDAFYKATWSNEQQEMSFYYLACIAMRNHETELALELIDKAIFKNYHNVKARGLKACILYVLVRKDEAINLIKENLAIDPFDYVSRYVLSLIDEKNKNKIINEMDNLMRGTEQNYLNCARVFAEYSLYIEAISVLDLCKKQTPMILYYKAAYCSICKSSNKLIYENILNAERADPSYCFPNKLEDIEVLKHAMDINPNGAKAYYYLGNLYYDKLRYNQAVDLWQKSVNIDPDFATVNRNLAIGLYNQNKNPKESLPYMEKAFALDERDARVFLELDQLYKKNNTSFSDRLKNYEAHKELVYQRDDLMIEYVTLYNLIGEYEKAYDIIMSHNFRPWEGAEGKITAQYKISLLQVAIKAIGEKDYTKANELLLKALECPVNLGEGKLEGTKDNNIYYYLGIVARLLGQEDQSVEYYNKATLGSDEVSGVMYYYDQSADMLLFKGLAFQKLDNKTASELCFSKLLDYGKSHFNDEIKNDFFAVSLPDFMVFDDDLEKRNKAHCNYVCGLAYIGLNKMEDAKKYLSDVLDYDFNHQSARMYLEMVRL